jgi:hypothetical protein
MVTLKQLSTKKLLDTYDDLNKSYWRMGGEDVPMQYVPGPDDPYVKLGHEVKALRAEIRRRLLLK